MAVVLVSAGAALVEDSSVARFLHAASAAARTSIYHTLS